MIEHFMFDTTQFYLVVKNGISMLRYQYMGHGEFTKDILLKNIELNDTELALERLNNNQYPVMIFGVRVKTILENKINQGQ